MESEAQKERPPDLVRMMTAEEFAAQMGVSRTTVFEWIRKGQLKAGKHYIKIGRVLRFPWGPELIQALLEDSTCEEQKTESPPPLSTSDRPPPAKPKRSPQTSALNWEY